MIRRFLVKNGVGDGTVEGGSREMLVKVYGNERGGVREGYSCCCY